MIMSEVGSANSFNYVHLNFTYLINMNNLRLMMVYINYWILEVILSIQGQNGADRKTKNIS